MRKTFSLIGMVLLLILSLYLIRNIPDTPTGFAVDAESPTGTPATTPTPQPQPDQPDLEGARAVYSVNPGFVINIDYSIDYYQKIAEDAKWLLSQVEICKQTFEPFDDPKLAGQYSGGPESVLECVRQALTHLANWKLAKAYEAENIYHFDISNQEFLTVYDGSSTKSREIVYKIALYIE
ncbi:MAG: hypothetical protein ABIG95_05805 [Candidatus Woesearchaeota archaeon]